MPGRAAAQHTTEKTTLDRAERANRAFKRGHPAERRFPPRVRSLSRSPEHKPDRAQRTRTRRSVRSSYAWLSLHRALGSVTDTSGSGGVSAAAADARPRLTLASGRRGTGASNGAGPSGAL